jgi:3-phosphoglycerate kinase
MKREIKYLSNLETPPRPYAAIVGGSKISTKIGVLLNLLDKVDTLLIGGAMVCFLACNGDKLTCL